MRMSNLKMTMAVAHAIDRPLLIWGAPGLGKSEGVYQYSASKKLQLLDWRLTLMDGVDMRGTPWKTSDGFTKWAPPFELPREGTEGILFLDELAQAKMEVKNIAAMLVLEKRIGEWRLPKGWWVCAASNRLGDAAGTSPMPTHLNNRFWHVDLDLSHDDFFAHAEQADFDYRVVAYLKYMPAALHEFDPRSKDAAFPTPRSWEGVSKIIRAVGEQREVLAYDPQVLSEMMSGNVGKARGEEFVGFLRVLHALTSMEEILRNPTTAPLPTEPSVCYAIVTGLTRAVTKANIANAFTYVERISKEFAFVFARKLEGEQPALRKTAAFVQFCAANADYI